MGELSAEQIWRWSQAAEANAPVWSRQAWGAWRLGNSLDIKNQEMSETGRFGFDAADARGHLGAALGEAVTKLRGHMSDYATSATELKGAMERVGQARGDTHTRLERLWQRYEATDDKVTRDEIEREMRARYVRFAADYRDEAASVRQFETYDGVRKPVDAPTHNSDRLGDNGQTDSRGTATTVNSGTPSGAQQPVQYLYGPGHSGHSSADPGPELQSAPPTAAGTPTLNPGAAPNPGPTPGTFHVPGQATVPPVIGARTGPPVHGNPRPALRPQPGGLVNPVNHGARTSPSIPSGRSGSGTAPSGSRARFGGEAGLNRGVISGARQRPKADDDKPNQYSGDAIEDWELDGDVVRAVITSRTDPEPFHDPGPMAFGPDRD